MLHIYKKFLGILITIGFAHTLSGNPVVEIFKDHQNRTIELKQIIDERLFALAAPIFTTALLKAYEHLTDEDIKLAKNSTRTERFYSYFQKEELLPFCEKSFWPSEHFLKII